MTQHTKNPDFQIPDFQIIGGGLIGLSTAYALLKRGASVRIIEARNGVALETSFANAGMVHASLADPWNSPGVSLKILGSLFGRPSPMTVRLGALSGMIGWGLKFLKHSSPKRHWYATEANYKLAAYSSALITEWRTELNICDDYQGAGLLKIFRDSKALSKASAITSKLIGLGLSAEFLTGKEAARKEPSLAPIANKLAGAIYYPDDYKADAYIFCTALAQEIIKLGGEIGTHANVKSLQHEGGNVTGAMLDNGKILRAKTTIIAAGAASPALLAPLNIALPIHPVKGYSLTFDIAGGHGGGFPTLPVVDDNLHCAVTPLGGKIRIAGTAEITGFDTSMSESRLEILLDMLRTVYPNLAQNLSVNDGQPWHGFRPVSADGIPIIGKINSDKIKSGLAINTGHAHMGWTLSAGSGELLADILLGEVLGLDARPYGATRL